jgi:hypothetical protein
MSSEEEKNITSPSRLKSEEINEKSSENSSLSEETMKEKKNI